MTPIELKSLIASGENSQVEFKRDDLRPEQLAREIVAFLNTHGGQVLIGVEDDGAISGLQRADVQEWVLNVFRDKIHPQIIPIYREVSVDGKTVAVISVPMGTTKPFVVRHNGREDMYLRMGNRTEPATREQQMRLFEAGQLLHVETMPVSGTGIDDLDLDRLGFYLTNLIQDDAVPANTLDWIDRLLGLGLMARDGLGHDLATVAGLVCFGFRPRRALRQAGLRVQVFDSVDLEYSAVLDRVLDRPLVGRWRKTVSGGRELLDPGLVEEFMALIEPYISRDRPHLVDHVRRERQWFYPSEAVRELTLNAFIHRDWTRSVDAEVTVFSDRLQIMSPGRLPNSMTLEKMLAGQRFPRNPIIQDVLRDYGYVDARGMGIRRKVVPQVRASAQRDPEFRLEDDRIVTVIPRSVE